jgi:hypothetical protein
MVTVVVTLAVWLAPSVTVSVRSHVTLPGATTPVVLTSPLGPAMRDALIPEMVTGGAPPGQASSHEYVQLGALQLVPIPLMPTVTLDPSVTFST